MLELRLLYRKFITVKKLKYASLCLNVKDGETYLIFNPCLRKMKVNALTCWFTKRLCGQNLKRLHSTCFRCPLVRYANRKLPTINKVKVCSYYVKDDLQEWKKVTVKKLASVVEGLSF